MTGPEARLREQLEASRQRTRRFEVELRVFLALAASSMTRAEVVEVVDADRAEVEGALARLVVGRVVTTNREPSRGPTTPGRPPPAHITFTANLTPEEGK